MLLFEKIEFVIFVVACCHKFCLRAMQHCKANEMPDSERCKQCSVEGTKKASGWRLVFFLTKKD